MDEINEYENMNETKRDIRDDIIKMYEDFIKKQVMSNKKNIDKLIEDFGNWIDGEYERKQITQDEYDELNLYIANLDQEINNEIESKKEKEKINVVDSNNSRTDFANKYKVKEQATVNPKEAKQKTKELKAITMWNGEIDKWGNESEDRSI